MKKSTFVLALVLTSLGFNAPVVKADGLNELFDRKEAQKKVKEIIANQDINFGANLGDINLIDGVNLSTKYSYDVQSSYINKFYTRIDKWDLNAGINVGEVLKELVDIPFSFSVSRNNSFFFVRQFPTKKEAILSIPYTPLKLPLTAKLALKNLNKGDFVSMPANLNIGVSLSNSTSYALPVIVNASASIYGVISGEFTIQVFKLDDTHVRLKLITQRSRGTGSNYSMGMNFDFCAIQIINKQIEKVFEKDLIKLGFSKTPQSQFILDYIFDLSDQKAQEAYDQILNSSFKFKDILVTEQILNAKELKDKLISSYEKADQIANEDKDLDPVKKRIQRIFKGFNSSTGHARHIKLSLLLSSYQKDSTYTESKVTFIDKNEKNLEFFYPTYSRYMETHLGQKWIFDLKDQSFQNNFGLIPRFNLEDSKEKNPEVGFTYERKDRYFTSSEQKAVEKFLLGQIPTSMLGEINFDDWRDGIKKTDSRIFLQLILKAQGFPFLKNIPEEELRKKLIDYVDERQQVHVIDMSKSDTALDNLKDFLFISRFIKISQLNLLARSISKILKNEDNNAETMLTKLVGLNEFGLFDRIGVGFLISLLPKDKLNELVYVKLEMSGKDLNPISVEKGSLNYRALYKELTSIQSRISNRSYDLRITDEDRELENKDIETNESFLPLNN